MVSESVSFHLVYSSNTVKSISKAKWPVLVARYRAKNHRLGITGMLLYKMGVFMQALEGEEATVRSLFATICDDPSHQRVQILVKIPVPARRFPDWPMGFRNFDQKPFSLALGEPSLPDCRSHEAEAGGKNYAAFWTLATLMHER